MGRISRRRILGAAAALTATEILAVSPGPRPAPAQAATPEEALTQLLSADQPDPSWFSPDLLARLSLDQIQRVIAGLHGLFGAFQSVAAAGDDTYLAQFDGGTVQLRATFDDQARLSAIGVAGVSYALAPDEQEIAFTSGGDTLYGTLLVPAGVSTAPAALLIAGSGPTDRNGNSPLVGIQFNTLASLARALAAAGVASLRYDKLGAGKTGPGGRSPKNPPAFADFLDEAQAAFAALVARPEVDATRTLAGGHSEGGLFAELVAQQEQISGLLLAAPASVPLLDTLRRQLIAQGDQALAAGKLTQDQYDRLRADLEATIASIRASGTIPDGVFADAPSVQAMFAQPGLGAYLQQEDGYDPATLAAQLPSTLPVLVLHGDLDMNVTEDELQHLLGGFQEAGNTSVQVDEFANVDHELRQLPPGEAPSLTAAYPFSAAVGDAVTAWAAALFGKQSASTRPKTLR